MSKSVCKSYGEGQEWGRKARKRNTRQFRARADRRAVVEALDEMNEEES